MSLTGPLHPYPEYKAIGSRDIAEIPAHWSWVRLGRLGRFHKGSGGTKDDEVASGVPCIRYGDLYSCHEFFITRSRSFVTEERAADYTPIRYGDVLFAGSGETLEEIGKSAVNLITDAACCGGDVLILRPGEGTNARFLGYACDFGPTAHQKSRAGKGVTVMHIYPDALKAVELAMPPADEQDAIVRFLAHLDVRIAQIIGHKRRLMALLREQRQTIVDTAVSRGVDGGASSRPSTLPGVRQVPSDWEELPFIRCTTERADYRGATPEKVESGVFLVTAKNVRMGWIDYEASKEYVRPDQYDSVMRRGLPRVGDLLFTTEAPLGNVALVDREDVAFAQRIIRFRIDPERVESQYMLYACMSSYFQNQLRVRATGSTAAGIKASKLPQLRIVVPPREEQKEILAYLRQELSRLDAAADRTQRGIDLVIEYRARLLADVMTGKVDVRAAASDLELLPPGGIPLPNSANDQEPDTVALEEVAV